MNKNRIIIDVGADKKKINPLIYSTFIEHIGECIHNGIWSYDKVNVPLVENNPLLVGVRRDLLHAMKELHPTVLRAFGGCFSDVYHWKDAIGRRNTRKKVANVTWGGADIENQFGTDEFLTLCEEIGAEPYLNVNYGTGTPEEASDWVEYCTGAINTEYGALRAKNGRKNPYNVRFWGIANEIYGSWEKGYEKSPENYGRRYLEYAKKMKEKKADIMLVACGCDRSKWNRAVLKTIGEEWIDYLSIHLYLPYYLAKAKEKTHPDNETCYHALMASVPLIENQINEMWNDIVATLGKNTHVRIAFDEWGLWYVMNDIIRTNYNLQDGIWAAMTLMMFQRMSDICPMTNWAQLVHCAGLIQTDPDGLILTPVYLAFKMLKTHSQNNLICNIQVECDTFDSPKFGRIPRYDNVPYIECNATIDEQNDELSIMIINKHFTDELNINLEIKGFESKEEGKLIELYSKSPFDYNTIENRKKIQINVRELYQISNNMDLELKAHSLSILKLKKNN